MATKRDQAGGAVGALTHPYHGGTQHRFEFELIKMRKDGRKKIKQVENKVEYLFVFGDGTACTGMDFFGDRRKLPIDLLKFHCWCYGAQLGKFKDGGGGE